MSYVIAGRKVGAEWLSIATLTTFFSGVAYAMSGPSKTTVGTSPRISIAGCCCYCCCSFEGLSAAISLYLCRLNPS